MNCEPGDLAVYVGKRLECVGHIAVVVEADIFAGAWIIDPPLPFARCLRGAVWDSSLRPIRDPGEDARDETLNWLPVPTKEHA